MGFDGLPFIIGWELTLACNLCCRHCGSSAGLPRDHELTPDEALYLCSQFPQLLVQEVDFTGGEPLLRRDWPIIAADLGKRGIKTKIITNGILLNADSILTMKDVGIAGVGVSLDGLETTHDRIRGRKGLFRIVRTAIEQLLKADMSVVVITTVTELNINELPSMSDCLKSMGVASWQIQPIFPYGRGCESAELLLSDKGYMQLGNLVRSWTIPSQKNSLEVLACDSFGYFTDLDTREPAWHGCPAGLLSCGITSDGKVKGCLSLPDEAIEGDLRRHDLWELWFHPDAFAYTRKFSPKVVGQFCQSCDRVSQCRGGCSAMSYGTTGLFHNDPYCFLGIECRTSLV